MLPKANQSREYFHLFIKHIKSVRSTYSLFFPFIDKCFYRVSHEAPFTECIFICYLFKQSYCVMVVSTVHSQKSPDIPEIRGLIIPILLSLVDY